MARPNRLKDIEREWNEPLETLVPRLLNEHGTIVAVALVLKVSFSTLWHWCDDHVEKRNMWTLKDGENVAL